MESLINLSVREYKIRVGDAKQIIDIEIYLDARLILDEFENRYSAGWYINQSACSGDLADYLAAHLDKLVVIVCERVKEDSCDINIGFLLIPGSVVATAKSRDQYLTCYLDRVVLVACLVESVLDTIDHLVSYLKVFDGYLLVFIYLLHELFYMPQLFSSPLAGKIDGQLLVHFHHVHIFPLLLLLDLLLVFLKS